jgi:hypothetical protein
MSDELTLIKGPVLRDIQLKFFPVVSAGKLTAGVNNNTGDKQIQYLLDRSLN